ncbi:hypothetical protein Cgig2_032543 [Carnegiea gigantea]|uniref:Uncharacterized protein n=1 Tax=Carnegiea gigantea TaxID=171969 RepID=A0A9Q1KXY0_9CARY|nr:hypothetical protein Cgig2_032543 [Carnegiea gigantea]
MLSSTASSRSSGGGGGGVGGGGGGGITSCQDCGNKAKRDCQHMRCRTCCKSRGLHCPTHVKSTWVPVARRRQRQQQQQFHHQQLLLPATDFHHLSLPLSLSRTSASLLHHHHHHRSPSSSGVEGGNFPAEVNSLATFRCIKVMSSENNVVDQYAYQTSINIGGHVFKGILYDQGPTSSSAGGGGETSSAATTDTPQQQFHHQFDIAAAIGTPTAAALLAPPPPTNSSAANLLYPSPPSLYSAPFNAFLPGMQFFPYPRP